MKDISPKVIQKYVDKVAQLQHDNIFLQVRLEELENELGRYNEKEKNKDKGEVEDE